MSLSTERLPASEQSLAGRFVDRAAQWPWWLLIIALGGVLIAWNALTSELYSAIFSRLTLGIGVTVFTTLVAYSLALVIGLLAGLGRVSTNPVVFNLATLYVQVIRGVPILVQLLVIAFVIVPLLIDGVNSLGMLLAPLLGAQNFLSQVRPPDVPFLTRCIIALAIAYGGFQAETFRAGIQSISRGQMEAARSLGMSYLQAMRYICRRRFGAFCRRWATTSSLCSRTHRWSRCWGCATLHKKRAYTQRRPFATWKPIFRWLSSIWP